MGQTKQDARRYEVRINSAVSEAEAPGIGEAISDALRMHLLDERNRGVLEEVQRIGFLYPLMIHAKRIG